jgi:anti-sigma B factor antagonist
MGIEPFEASVRHLPGVAIIDLRGDVDGDAEELLEDAYATAEQEEPAVILFNFSQVDYINSKGIALLVVLLRRAIASDRRLLACGLNEHYAEIFRITRLSDYIAVCTDEKSALAKIRIPEAVLQASSG